MPVSSWRQNLIAVTAASFIGFAGFTLVMPFLPLYFQQLGVTDVGEVAIWTGLSLGITPAGAALLAPFWGRLADRFGRKIIVERSLGSFVVVMAAMAWVTEAWHIFALRAVQGLFAGYGALTLTMAADIAPKDRVAFAIGFVQTAQRLGPAIGPLIGAAVAQVVGLRRAFLVTAAFYLVALVLVFLMYDERGIRPDPPKREEGRVTFRSVLAFQNFLLLMVVIFGLQFIDRSLGPVLPLYVDELGTPTSRVPMVAGGLFSLAAAAGAVGHYWCGKLLRRMTPRAVLAASTGAGAVGAMLYVFAPGTWILFIGTPIFGAAIGVATTAAYTAANGVMPASARGAGFGLLTTASLTGLAVSPMAAGFLATTSIRAVFLLDAAGLLVLAAMVTRLMTPPRLPLPARPPAAEV
jgi:MFS transporter, DHA1 family, multidrug resistance protein